ncbi:hypothetical protein ACFQZQ_08400 [Lysobacter koreensis]|uniref:Anti-sigma factor n=1 Tax=Lysobacter koreensis TaxID=266122 RepID=A0ABW2YM81_9GAMM
MDTEEELSAALRWQLRALRRDEPPPRDLWTGIAERLPARQPARARRSWLAPVAAAAGIVLAIGVVGVWQGAGVPAPGAVDTLVQREADGMTRQYQAALRELAPAPAPALLQPTLDELDREVALIHDALTRDPDSRLLLERLRRTYAHRLALAQRFTQGIA